MFVLKIETRQSVQNLFLIAETFISRRTSIMIISLIMQWNPEIYCSPLSMALCQTAGADATVNKSLKNKPLNVLMVRYFL